MASASGSLTCQPPFRAQGVAEWQKWYPKRSPDSNIPIIALHASPEQSAARHTLELSDRLRRSEDVCLSSGGGLMIVGLDKSLMLDCDSGFLLACNLAW